MHRSNPLMLRLLPALVVLLASSLRFWHLGIVPPGFQFDEAHNAIDAARVLGGTFALFFTENGGREPLVTYLHATTLGLLGRHNVVLALRLVSAFVGVTTVAVLYGFGTRFFCRRNVGVLAAAFLAISYWHVHFSRYAIRAVLAPLWTTAALWAWWIAIGGSVRRPDDTGSPGSAVDAADDEGTTARDSDRTRLLAAALCGVLLAVAVYSHPSGRLVPLILLGHVIYRTAAVRTAARDAWRALIVAGIVALIVFLPLGGYFAQHTEQFTSHPSDVSLAVVADADHDGSIARALAANVAATAGMFFVKGDPSTFHNLPDLPVFDPLSALFAVMGVGVVLGWMFGSRADRRDRSVLIALWLVVGLLPTLLSDRPPNYSRAMAALPVVVMLPAVGLDWATRLISRQAAVYRSVLTVAVIAVATLWTTYQYFVAFARLPHIYYSYDVEKVDAYTALRDMSDEAAIYLHPLWSGHATFRFLDEEHRATSLDGRDTVVLPADGRDAVVVFPAKEAEREGWTDQIRSLVGRAATYDTIVDAQGAPLMHTVQVSRKRLGDLAPPPDAPLEPDTFDGSVFSSAFELVGYTAGEAVPGEPLPLVLVWRSKAPVDRDLTMFAHLVGADGERVGQLDREPAHASYRTSQWAAGDVIVDRLLPVLSEDARGTVFVRLGWYDRETGERLQTDDGHDSVNIGPVVVRGSGP